MSFRRAAFATQPVEGSRLLSVLQLGKETRENVAVKMMYAWKTLKNGVVLQLPCKIVEDENSHPATTDDSYAVRLYGKDKVELLPLAFVHGGYDDRYDWKSSSWAKGQKVYVNETEIGTVLGRFDRLPLASGGVWAVLMEGASEPVGVYGDGMEAVDKDMANERLQALEAEIVAEWGRGVLRLGWNVPRFTESETGLIGLEPTG